MNSQNLLINPATDITGKNSVTAADIIALINQAKLYDDGAGNGKGIVLNTTDSALGIPVVPNPNATTTEWKHAVWIRTPFAGSTNKIPSIYAWNEDATSIATYLKWQNIVPNVDSYTAAVASLTATSSNALDTAQAAQADVSALGATVTILAQSVAAYDAQVAGLVISTNAAQADATTALANSVTNAADIANANTHIGLFSKLAIVKYTETAGTNGVTVAPGVLPNYGTPVSVPFNTISSDHDSMILALGVGVNKGIQLTATGTYQVDVEVSFVGDLSNNPYFAASLKIVNAQYNNTTTDNVGLNQWFVNGLAATGHLHASALVAVGNLSVAAFYVQVSLLGSYAIKLGYPTGLSPEVYGIMKIRRVSDSIYI